MPSDDNKNWGKCPTCGSPVLIDPESGRTESCSNCLAKASPTGLYLGGLALILGVAGVVLLVYFGIRMLPE